MSQVPPVVVHQPGVEAGGVLQRGEAPEAEPRHGAHSRVVDHPGKRADACRQQRHVGDAGNPEGAMSGQGPGCGDLPRPGEPAAGPLQQQEREEPKSDRVRTGQRDADHAEPEDRLERDVEQLEAGERPSSAPGGAGRSWLHGCGMAAPLPVTIHSGVLTSRYRAVVTHSLPLDRPGACLPYGAVCAFMKARISFRAFWPSSLSRSNWYSCPSFGSWSAG